MLTRCCRSFGAANKQMGKYSMDAASDDAGRSAEERNGALKTALGQAIQKSMAARSSAGQQIALFDLGDQLPDDAAEGTPGPRGRGRPPGSSNKLTDAFRRFVRSQYGDPLLKLVERAFADTLVLAEALGMKPGEVWQAQNGIMERLLPIFHSPMPAELKVTAKGYLAVGISAAPNSLAAGDRVLEGDPFAALLQIAQYQRVSDAGRGQSNDEQSNEALDITDGSKA
jgi:hypothetical protein